MGIYDPNPQVCINFTDYTSDTINSVSISAGRQSVDEQPRPSYAKVSVLVVDDSYPPIKLNDCLQVSVSNSTGIDPKLFSGYVTDITRQIVAHGQVGTAVLIEVSAVGNLARLSRFTTADSYSKEFDGDRIYNILQDALTTSWDEVPSALTWSALPSTTEWATYDTGYVGTIDQPGAFELVAYSGGEVAAKSLTDQVADSALGILYETPDGYINYDAASARITRVANEGYTEVPAEFVVAAGTSSNISSADLINSMSVTYKNNDSVFGEDADSILIYGKQAGSKSTLLETEASAEMQRDLYLATRSQPRENISSVTIPLHNPDLPDATRDALLGVYCGFPLSIPDLPASIKTYGFAGFVEGYTWTLTDKTAFLTMNVSDYGLTAIQQSWQQVSSAELWNTISPTLDWENARTVA